MTVAPQNIVVLGASSSIARALAEEFASTGHRLILAGRDLPEIELTASDLRIRFNATVEVQPFDACDYDQHEPLLHRCIAAVGEIDGVMLCHGSLVEHSAAIANLALARQVVETNYISAVSILSAFANYFESNRRGWICAISSVAGDRGRQSNYIYGSSKAGLSVFLEGLRQRLFCAGVAVITVKPGFVDTAMTWGLPGVPFAADPRVVARDIHKAIRRRCGTIYTPWFWRFIMLIIRCIPEPIFKRMKL